MPNGERRYRFAGFVLDVGERTLHADGRHVYLPPKTFETLRYLVEHPGHLVTKADLLDAVWPGVAVTENALTRCIKEVRAALADDVHAPRCIETVPRVGYRFIAPVTVEGGGEAAAASPAPAVPARHEAVARVSAAGPSRFGGTAPGASWGRRLLTLLSVAGVLVLVPIGSYLATPPGQQMGFGPRDFVLVADLDNRTGDPVFDRSLTTAFTSLLGQSRYANVFPRVGVASSLQRMGRPKDAPVDEETGREICQRENVRGLVTTTLARVGGQYAFTARLVEPVSGRVVRSRVESAAGHDGLLEVLKRVAAALRGDLGESLAAIATSDHPLEQVTTPSLTALKRYSDGMAMWDRGEYKAAVQLYTEAVEADPGFAAAHAALGAAYYGFVFADRAKGQAHFQQALALAGRTTDREQRLIRLSHAHQLGHWDEAYDLYRAYLQSYPDDFRVRHNFGAVLRQLARFEEAAAEYREVLRVAPHHASAHVNLATCYNPLGRYEDALRHYDAAFELEPSWLATPNINHEYGFVLVRAGQLAKARATFEGALGSPAKASALRSLALLDMYEGRYGEAIHRLDEAVRLNVATKGALNEARNRLFLAQALAARGDTAGARRELGRATRAAHAAKAAPWVVSRIGVAMARAGMAREAAAALDEVRAAVDEQRPDEAADLLRLEGEVALARGDHAAAIERLTLADATRRSAFTVASLARARAAAGHDVEAMALLAQLVAMAPIALGFEPQQDWIDAHPRLAALRLAHGDRAGAEALAAAFGRHWSGADDRVAATRAMTMLRASLDRSAGRRGP